MICFIGDYNFEVSQRTIHKVLYFTTPVKLYGANKLIFKWLCMVLYFTTPAVFFNTG